MSKPADNRTLPIKESNLFKQVVKHYEVGAVGMRRSPA